MTRVSLACIAMVGSQYVLYERAGVLSFPEGELREGEAVADAMRRLVEEWTGTRAPKLELVDLQHPAGELRLVYRAMLIDEPKATAAPPTSASPSATPTPSVPRAAGTGACAGAAAACAGELAVGKGSAE